MTTKEIEIPIPHNQSMNELMTLIKARNKLIYVVTSEEKRFLEDFEETVAKPMKIETWLWSTHQGLLKYGEHLKVDHATGEMDKTERANVALSKIADMNIPKEATGCVYILRDLHTVLSQGLPRQLRDLLYRIRKKTIIITAPELGYSTAGGSAGLPLIIDKNTVVLEYNLMTKKEITSLLKYTIGMTAEIAKKQGKSNKLRTKYSKKDIEALCRACQGLTEPEIQTAICTSMVDCSEMNIDRIIKTKEQLVQKSQILEFIGESVKLSDVGGLDEAKRYFETYKNSFSEEAKKFGVEPPTGILLTGIPGGGKSLLAKAICKAWGLPGIRLDIGKVMNGLVGGSEQNMRAAIKQAESLAPCVTGDTIIHTKSHGNITAEELHKKLTIEESKDQVQITTKDNFGNKINAEIYTVVRREASDKKLLKITTENGKTITVTENHKFLIKVEGHCPPRYIWKKAEDLTEEDNIVEE